MKQFVSFIVKEARHIFRDKRTMLILFGMPVVMMFLFGFAISTDVRNVRTVIVTSQIDAATSRLSKAIGASEYFTITNHVTTPREAEVLLKHQEADIAIVFERDFESRRLGIQIMTDAVNPNMAQQYQMYARQIIGSALHPKEATLRSVYQKEPVVVKYLYNPSMKSAYNFVPGIMGMILMLICAMMTSISIAREKERGTMEVLLVSPVRPIVMIIAKAIPYLVLALFIMATILLISNFVLGVPLEGNLVSIIAVSMLYILLALTFGILISIVAKTQLVALLMSAMMLILPTLMLSGMLFPIESMPRVLQCVAAILPPQYYISAMRKLMIMGVSLDCVVREVIVLSSMLALLLTVALKKFNKRLE